MTPKQEAFARAYVETGNASEAYRRAYAAKNMKPEAIAVEGCRLLDNPKVALMVLQLKEGHRARAQEKHEITVDKITEMLQEDRKLARELGQTSAAVSANMGLAKIHGLIIEKREDVTQPRSTEQVDARIRQLLALRDQIGTAEPARAKRPDRAGPPAVPTVPGRGTA